MPGSGPVQRERRNLTIQRRIIDGARVTDPRLTTRDCGDRLGVTPRFIVGEILDGRLVAHARRRPGHRVIYRVSEFEFDVYKRRYWPSARAGAEPKVAETPGA